MSAPVFICANAFGPIFVKHHGHATVANLASRAGAQGLEIRQELMTPADLPLSELNQVLDTLQLGRTFSSTVPLWSYEHCNIKGLLDALTIAKALNVSLLKIGIGALPKNPAVCQEELATFAKQLKESGIRLVIENDQTPEGGDINVMENALTLLENAGVEVGLAFDTGNWHWVGEAPIDAAHQLGKRVDYIHCKSIDMKGHRVHVCQPRAIHLANWATLWSAFPPNTLRAIEFPLAQEDSEDQPYSALIATAHEFVTRLSHY